MRKYNTAIALLFCLAPLVSSITPAAAHAAGSCPIRFRNAGPRPVYFCVDNTGAGSPFSKTMKDGRPGTLLVPGDMCVAPNTCLFDRPTLRIYNADGIEIYRKALFLLPSCAKGCKQLWTGQKLVPDDQ